jgi:molybdopterin-guanine dinucleotide biosynthesis protein A
MSTPRISGYVLAGGESSRMQQDGAARVDKALLRFDGATLLERALGAVRDVCGDAAILCGPTERCEVLRAYGRTVPDRVTQCGPMGGVAAALEDAEGDWLLVMPVDLPLLPASALRALVDLAMQSGEPKVTCFDGVDHRQPLPVVLHRSAAPVLAEALEHGERRLMPVLQRAAEVLSPLGMRLVPVESLTWLTNVNTPEELRAAEEMAMASNDLTRRASE